ncbi:MAG: ATP-binding protein [Saprospiraceae bacterium]
MHLPLPKSIKHPQWRSACFAMACWLLCCHHAIISQNSLAFSRIVEHSYGINDGLHELCVEKVYLDSRGHLFIVSCQASASRSLLVYEYDGRQSYPAAFKLEHKPILIFFEEATVENLIYGSYTYTLKDGSDAYALFQYNTITGRTMCFDMPDKAAVHSVLAAEDALFACVFYPESRQWKILCVRDGGIVAQQSFSMDFFPDARKAKLAITPNDYWVVYSLNIVYRINRADGTLRQYTLPDISSGLRSNIRFFFTHGKDLWLWRTNGIFLWDVSADRFIKNPYWPSDWQGTNSGQSISMAKDLQDNVLIRYVNLEEQQRIILIDAQHEVTEVTSAHWTGPKDVFGIAKDFGENKFGFGHNFRGNDFKQGILFYTPGLQFVQFTANSAIQAMVDDAPYRSMVQLDEQTIMTTPGWKIPYTNGAWIPAPHAKVKKESPDWVTDMKKDSLGNIWRVVDNPENKQRISVLLRLNSTSQTVDSFFTDQYIQRFDFKDDDNIVFASNQNVYLFNISSRRIQLLTRTPFESPINQVLVGSNGIIWIAASMGLFKLDLSTGEEKWISLLSAPTGILRIHENAQGILWLGTPLNGVLRYEPGTGRVKVIDQTKGLSNNTVVNLLEDNDGDIWAGTFMGISLISPEGEVIGKVYKENGLVDNECNRWSQLKLADGRLAFGTNKGLSFIDPTLYKKQIQERAKTQIYLTGLTTQASDQSSLSIDLFQQFKQNESIVLPANSRNLEIRFALSEYSAPESSTFAYRIEGYNNEWNYIGNQRKLNLNALPAGNYNILVKGADRWGQWSENPVVIPVTVQEFFYKRWWFYLLCALPFVVIFFIWQQRQRGERIRLEREVQNRTATIKQQADKLMEADQMKSRLYTNITHEFRTPLTVISGLADMIEKPTNAKDLIKNNSQSLLRLVNQMLDLTKLESGHLKMELMQADVIPYVQYLVEAIHSLAEAKGIGLVFSKETDQVMMDFDEKKLESIVFNLLSNAIKFTPKNGLVTLHVQEAQDNLQITVTDNGIGIAPDKLPHIFDRFYQVDDSATRQGEGTGIGLTLTRELVELMGGSIRVQSPGPQGAGTEFVVSLPITQVASKSLPGITPTGSREEKASVGAPEISAQAQSADLPLLLLIEDNADVVTYIKLCLQDRYTIEWAENGAIGIEKALEIIPDIIISDVMMPEKDGYEVCDTLKNDERTSHIPIILLTAKADIDSRLQGLRTGADDYLTKPFLKEELLIRLEKMVELRRTLQARYARMAGAPMQQPPVEPTLDDTFLQKIADWVEANLSDSEFGGPSLAGKMLLSESQLSRKIKALTGQSTAIHIRSIRLRIAREMLQQTRHTVSEIAYETGFTSPFYFSRAFSQEFGFPPSDLHK